MPRRSPAILPAVALLRGINVGGKNRIAMSDLADVFASAGCGEVRTYIQSGNVLFTASPALLGRVPERVSREIAARFGLRVPVVVRTADELRECVRRNPYLDSGAEAATLHVVFLADQPPPDRVAKLDTARSPGDRFIVRGRDIYLHLLDGVARTKLGTDYFDSRLSTTSTMRNWRTVTTLAQLAGEPT